MRVAVNGAFLTKPFSGIGRYTCELALALKADAADCHFVANAPLHSAYDDYTEQLTVTDRLPQADIYWGPAHRLPRALPKGLPTVVTVHDLVWKTHPETMRWRTWLGERALFARALARADRIACISRATADDLRRFFPQYGDKIRLVPPGAHAPLHANETPKQPFALFVGTFEPRKNLARLIAAYAKLPQSQRDACHVIIAGRPGWGGVDVASLIAAHGMNDNIHVKIAPSHDALHRLYARCSFLLLPSLYEGFGLPIIEAAAYGKPCLTSTRSSMPEAAGAGGLLINPLSEDEIGAAFTELISNGSQYDALADVARKSAQDFSWGKASKAMIKTIEELTHQ
jgi:glycosyltransferase involved in cell wall biosynthesis